MGFAMKIALSIIGGNESFGPRFFKFDVSSFDGQDIFE